MKKIKLILAVILCVSILCSCSVTAMAIGVAVGNGNNGEIIVTPETEEPKPITTQPRPEPEPDTQKPTESETEEETETEPQTDYFTDEEEESLPDGQFYVYLELNNGTKRLRQGPLSEPTLVAMPDYGRLIREGFIFDGWYADAEFTKKWDFAKDLAVEGTVIYAKWVPDPNAVVYSITVKQNSGGIIEVNPDSACPGEPVIINVYPDSGMRLKHGSVRVNGQITEILSFTMLQGDVVVEAEFEAVPKEAPVEGKPSILPFIIGGAVILIAIIIVIFIVVSRRDSFSEDEIDENGTIIDTDSDDKSWVDESIVVEDGFKDGEKTVGNYNPETDSDFFGDDE